MRFSNTSRGHSDGSVGRFQPLDFEGYGLDPPWSGILSWSVAGDTEAQFAQSEGERANLDPWLRNNLESMLGQGYAEMFPSRYRNMQVSVLYLEPVAGDELLFESIWVLVMKPLRIDFFLAASIPAARDIAQSL